MTSIRDDAHQERPTRIARQFLEKENTADSEPSPPSSDSTSQDLLHQYLSKTIELIEQLRRKQTTGPTDLEEDLRSSIEGVLHEIEGLRTEHKTLNLRVAQIQNSSRNFSPAYFLICLLVGIGTGIFAGQILDFSRTPTPPPPTPISNDLVSPRDSLESKIPPRLSSLENQMETVLTQLTDVRILQEESGTAAQARLAEHRRLIQRVDKALDALRAVPSPPSPEKSSPQTQSSPQTDVDLEAFIKSLNRLFADTKGQPLIQFRRIRELKPGRMLSVTADEVSANGEVLRHIEARECLVRIEARSRRIVFEFKTCRLLSRASKPSPLSTLELPSYGIDLFDIDPISWIQILGKVATWEK
ncbi:MAG: hypothetical protein QF752_09380 [Planctomycetota bacterium]|nr:hypothetical protein [Planctomycetota bacterium]